MKQSELLKKGKELLIKNNISDAEIKAKTLLQFILKQTREEYIINSLTEVEPSKEKEYKENIDKVIKGKPLQYITNNQEFMGLNFYVDENVLIPQPDTEILVENAINIIKKENKKNVLDLCTGSGAIAVSIVKNIENINVTASDISRKAIEIAIKNAVNNKVENKIEFMESDMFLKLENRKFDVIVSNPPYIETEVIPTLDEEVKQEPILALDGGKDGLKFYKVILENASNYLNPNGYLLFEIGYDQGEKIIELYEELKKENKCDLEILTRTPVKDFANNDRVMIFNKR